MKPKPLLNRYFQKKSRIKTVSLAVFTDSVTLVYENAADWVVAQQAATTQEERVAAITGLIASHQLGGGRFRLVLGHGLYQSMLIEKPDLPRDEYPTALPFLIKDLVNESPMTLVADGFPAPLKDRLQVFVTARAQVEQFVRVCTQAGGVVELITAEEVAWGQLTAPTLNQLVMHRRHQGNLQLTAFKHQEMCFQRQLRGFPVPLLPGQTADASTGALQLDSLALELQRSLDFLSAQLREAPITQLQIACDDEDDEALAAALRQRLSVAVHAIAPAHPALGANAARIAHAVLAAPLDSGINFYSDALKPKIRLMTLRNVVLSWLLGVVLFGSLAGWLSWQNYHKSQLLAAEKSRLESKQGELDRAKVALAKHLPSPLKVEVAGELEQHLADQQAMLAAIEMHDDSLKVGYAGMLQQLSQAASGDISLQRIRVSGRQMDLAGLARTADAVPSWLQAFQAHPALAERRFEQMTLGRNERNIVTFALHAERQAAPPLGSAMSASGEQQ